MHISQELAETHYGEHKEKPFFGELVKFIIIRSSFCYGMGR